MEMHFVRDKENDFVLEREKERKIMEQNLKVKRKLQKICEKRTLRKEFYTSGLIKIKFNGVYNF